MNRQQLNGIKFGERITISDNNGNSITGILSTLSRIGNTAQPGRAINNTDNYILLTDVKINNPNPAYPLALFIIIDECVIDIRSIDESWNFITSCSVNISELK